MATKEIDPQLALQDGRSIDPTLGILSGEASHVKVKNPDRAWPLPTEAVTHLGPTDLQRLEDGPSYYGLPMLKEPVWKPVVPFYFWAGGAAGASALVGLTSWALGGKPLGRFTARARWLAALGDNLGAACLVYDLGRPTRFLNMLRVFRHTSPMSVGSWILAASGAANTGSALFGGRGGVLGALGTLGGVVGGVLGMPLAGYTAVLIANSAIPVWQEGRRALPLLFMSSGVASAGSLLALLPSTKREARAAGRYALAGQLGELAATAMLHREVGRVRRAARPLTEGLSGALLTTATALTAASVVTALLPGRGAGKRRAAAILGVLGSLALRFGIARAGTQSARDARASFAQQRTGHGTPEVSARTAIAPSTVPTAV